MLLLGRVTMLKLAALTLVMLASPAHTFFMDRTDNDRSDEADDRIVRPLVELALGGGTKIVYNMLTFSYLGPVKTAIQELTKAAVVNGVGFVLSTIISSIWAIIGLVLQFLYWFIEISIIISWMIKWAIISFILDQLNPFSRRADTVNVFFGRSLLEELFNHSSAQ